MGVTTTQTNKPFNPRGNDQSPKGYNRASLFSGKALDFDGVNDYVDLDGFTLSGTSATISFYYKSDSNKALAYIFDNSQRWVIGQADTIDSFGFYDGSTWGKSTQTLTLGEWYHITAVIDGGNVEFLWNGESVGDTFTGANPISWASLTTFKLGWSYNANGIGQVNGQIAGFKVFNTALTAAQVADLYNNPEKVVPTGLESNLKLWLPMMEGAGTTAYDGSGNGNHGTISGATYVNGIGAPSPQSAVMDWNKAKNDIGRSQEFDNAYWGKGNLSVTANATTAPDGTTTADKLATTATTPGINSEIYSAVGFSANDSASVFVKSDTAQWVTLGTNRTLDRVVFFDVINGVVGTESTGYTGAITEYPNGWYKLDAYWDGTAATAQYWDLSIADADNAFGVTAGKSVFAWGAYANKSGTTIGPYIATLTNSTITTPVLLPQGLTTGRDITGVNLFENVRKQGALNLDGNSWAEVHDNASLDVTTAVTLEAWVNNKTGELSANNRYMAIFDKATGLNGANGFTLRLYSTDSVNGGYFATNGTYILFDFTDGSYQHIVATIEANSQKIYINGALQNSYTNAWTLPQNGETLKIGYAPSDGEQWLNGSIAQPRIYNRALTAEEVQRSYDSNKNIYTNS